MEAPPSPDYIPGPEAPPSPDYIPGPEAPPSPDYIPGPEAPPSPVYIPGPEYPEYLPPADDVLPAEEQPLPAAVSPTAESPRYITDLELEMDLEKEDGDDEKSEGDFIDYPTSRGDDDADDDGDELSEDDADDEDEEESSDSEEEKEEHLAPTVPAPALHSSVSASEDSDQTEPFEEGETATTPPPSAYLLLGYLFDHIYLCHSVQSQSVSIPETDMPLWKRTRFTTPTGGYKVGESFVAAAARQIRPALTVDGSRRAEDRLIGRLRRESTLVTQIKALQRDVSTLQGQQIDDEDRLTRHIQHEHAQRDAAPKDDKIERYVGGLPEMIRGIVMSYEPKSMRKAIEFSNDQMDQKLLGIANRQPEIVGIKLLTPTIITTTTTTTIEGPQRHIKEFPLALSVELKAGNVKAVARAYIVGTAGGNPDANVVTGTFLLNNRCALILFDTGADKSFVSTAFSSIININPSTLDYSYDVELADGQIIRVNTVVQGCTLNFLNHPFNNDLMPVELGSFDVII
nr:reverse transcriptase domain-containing protein [Tanacetum cinerariifolium]